MPNTNTSNRGFASMSPEQRREIASMGGRSQGQHNNPANFARNPGRASEAGRKGGQSRGQNTSTDNGGANGSTEEQGR